MIEVRISTEHPFHLHGMEFEVLSINGQRPELRIEYDYAKIRDRVRLLLHANNQETG